jgi:hypothetical protein
VHPADQARRPSWSGAVSGTTGCPAARPRPGACPREPRNPQPSRPNQRGRKRKPDPLKLKDSGSASPEPTPLALRGNRLRHHSHRSGQRAFPALAERRPHPSSVGTSFIDIRIHEMRCYAQQCRSSHLDISSDSIRPFRRADGVLPRGLRHSGPGDGGRTAGSPPTL